MWRIGNPDSLSYDKKYPVILNRDHRLTELLVWDSHNHIKHLGERQTLAVIRFCYWVPRSKSFVEKILHHCLICRNLPNITVKDNVACYGTTVDYLGPLYGKGICDVNSLEDEYGLFN